MTGSIRELFVTLGIDVDSKKLKEFDKGLKDIKQGMTAIVSVAGLVAAKMGAAFAMVSDIASTGNELKRTAGVLGMTTKTLQEMRYAAKGVEPETLTMAFRRMAMTAAKGTDEMGRQTNAFQKLGIQTRDSNGELKAVDKLLMEVADKFKGTSNATEKLAMATQLFGRGGTNMIAMMNIGSEGIAKLRQEFVDLGGVMSEQTIADSAEFEHNMKRLKTAAWALQLALGKDLIPEISKLIEKAITWTKEFNKTWVQTGKLNEVLRITKNVLMVIGAVLAAWGIGKVVTGIYSLTAAMVGLGNAGLLAQIKTFALVVLIGAAVAAVVLIIQDVWLALTDDKAITVSGLLWKAWSKKVVEYANEIKESLHFDIEFYTWKFMDINIRRLEAVLELLKKIKAFFTADYERFMGNTSVLDNDNGGQGGSAGISAFLKGMGAIERGAKPISLEPFNPASALGGAYSGDTKNVTDNSKNYYMLYGKEAADTLQKNMNKKSWDEADQIIKAGGLGVSH